MLKSLHIDPGNAPFACSARWRAPTRTRGFSTPRNLASRSSISTTASCLHLHPVRRGVVHDRLSGRRHLGGPPDRRPRWYPTTCASGARCAPSLPVRHRELQPRYRQGHQMRPLRRPAGLRRGLPDRRHRLSWTPTGPVTTRCAAGPEDRFRRRPGACVRGESDHGLDTESPARQPEQGDVRKRAAQHGLGAEVPGPARLASKYLVEEVNPKVDPLGPTTR